MSSPIKLTHSKDESIFIINADQIESVIEVIDGTMIQLIGKSTAYFTVKETIEEIEALILRDQFAMSALQGLLADTHRDNTTAEVCYASYKIADEMLKARKVK